MRTVAGGRYRYVLDPAKPGDALLPVEQYEINNQTPATPTSNRRQRRVQALFNKKLRKKLSQDGSPVKLEVLPDGGLHFTVEKPVEPTE